MNFIQKMSSRQAIIYGWVVSSLVAIFYCYEYILRISPGVMMSHLMHNFQIRSTGLGMLAGVYYFIYTPMQLVVGPLIDYFGSRKILILALLSCVIGCYIFGLNNNFTLAVIGRFLIGFGSAFAFVATLRLAANWLPNSHFPLFVGLATALGMIGAMFGDIEMVHLMHHIGWQRMLHLLSLVGCILIPLFLLFIYDHQDKHESLITTPKNFFVSLLTVLKNREIILAGIIACMLYSSLSIFADVWGLSYIKTLLHSSKILAAKVNSLVYLGWLIGAPFFGWFSEKAKRYGITIVDILICVIALAMLCIFLILFYHHFSLMMLQVLVFCFGFFSSGEVLCFVMAKNSVPSHQAATALGLVNFFTMLAGAFVLPLVGWLLDFFWTGVMVNGVRYYGILSFEKSLMVMPVMLSIAIFSALLLQRNQRAH